jgi:hypothetical protein
VTGKIGLSKNIILCALSSVFFLIFFGFSVCNGRYVWDHLSGVSARYDTAVVTAGMVKKALAGIKKDTAVQIPEITLWNRIEQETVKSVGVDISEGVNVIETCGDMSQVIPMEFICGNYVYQGDKKGCVLDAKTAYKLFGTTDIVNNTVEWKKKKYVVRGVAKAKDIMMLIQTEDENHEYANIEAVYGNRKHKESIDNQGQLLKDMLIQQMGVNKQAVIIDGDLTSHMLYAMYHMPLWIIAFGMLFMMMKGAYRYRRSMVVFISMCLLTLVAMEFLIKITDFNIYIPGQFIPTKWSDFDFYGNKFKEMQETIVKIGNCKRMPKDNLRNHYRNSCLVFTALDILMLFLVKLLYRLSGFFYK